MLILVELIILLIISIPRFIKEEVLNILSIDPNTNIYQDKEPNYFMMDSGEIINYACPRDYEKIAKLIENDLSYMTNPNPVYIGLICDSLTRDNIIDQIFKDIGWQPDIKFGKTFIRLGNGSKLFHNFKVQNFKGMTLKSCYIFDRTPDEVRDIKVFFAPQVFANTKVIYEDY